MKIVKYISPLLGLALLAASCKKDTFVNINVDPNTLYAVDPAAEFLEAGAGSQSDFEYYYDVYRDINYWMQYTTNPAGNSPTFTTPQSNFNYRYGVFYGKVGRDLADMPVQVSRMTPDQQARKQNILAIAAIFKAYYAFYVSDINGSIPYTDAFQARQGGTLTPKYDTQQDLFDTLDTQIKTAVHTLETNNSATQDSLALNDPFYGRLANNTAPYWIKAGNALRLKIALRLMKRSPDKLTSIAQEVLADANQMSSNDDGWVLLVGPAYANASGNWNPSDFPAAKPFIDFLNTNGDPRLGAFFMKDNQGGYRGSWPSPDEAKLPANKGLYNNVDTFAQIQPRLFAPNYDYGDGNGAGTGVGFFPLLTYAEYCFIRADLAARGIAGSNPDVWYANGIKASVAFYDERAIEANIKGYVSKASTVNTYLAMPDIAYDATKGIEQIACQANIELFRQPSEAWAWWKRTGFPNTTTVLPWSDLKANGAELVPPRRAMLVLSLPTYSNYNNQKAAYDAMASDPNFGALNDPFGRVWWDAP
ncbi:MAG TPA: SusD/RagB family nutrient-binding outer membrane lipoprotein [Puia sp.]|nr:SusD/RagB family nutrient-binding outer membrane lipoprotein [Puia sp.]